MYCIHCGAELPDGAKFCRKCGQPQDAAGTGASEYAKTNQNTYENHSTTGGAEYYSSTQNTSKNDKGSFSSYGNSYVNSKQNNIKRNKSNNKTWIIAGIIFLLLLMLNRCGKSTSSNKSENASPKPTEMASVTQKTETSTSETKTSAAAVTENAEHVFYIDLEHNSSDYDGKLIEVTVPVEDISSTGRIYVDDSTGGKQICIISEDEELYKKEDDIKFINVEGRVSVSSYVDINDVTINSTSSTAPDDYTTEMNEFEAAVIRGKIAARDEYVASAQEVSYNDLSRYPDTYKDKQIKLSIYVTEVEADGWFSAGTIHATYNGNEIIIYDDRDCREPRLKDGDYITIYGDGDGLTKITTYVKGTGILGSDLGADVVDEREVPAINMKYTANDNVDLFTIESSSYVYGEMTNYDYYLIGKDIPAEN